MNDLRLPNRAEVSFAMFGLGSRFDVDEKAGQNPCKLGAHLRRVLFASGKSVGAAEEESKGKKRKICQWILTIVTELQNPVAFDQ